MSELKKFNEFVNEKLSVSDFNKMKATVDRRDYKAFENAVIMMSTKLMEDGYSIEQIVDFFTDSAQALQDIN